MTTDTCVVGWKDWTKRDRCGLQAVCELQLLHNGRPRVFPFRGKPVQWRPACYRCASGLQTHVLAMAGDDWSLRERPASLLRDALNPPTADVIPLDARRSA